MGQFSYKGECGVRGCCTYIGASKKSWLGLKINNWVISLFKTVIPLMNQRIKLFQI